MSGHDERSRLLNQIEYYVLYFANAVDLPRLAPLIFRRNSQTRCPLSPMLRVLPTFRLKSTSLTSVGTRIWEDHLALGKSPQWLVTQPIRGLASSTTKVDGLAAAGNRTLEEIRGVIWDVRSTCEFPYGFLF